MVSDWLVATNQGIDIGRSLFASSLLGIVRTLLEQAQQDEMQILGCSILADFVNSQVHQSISLFELVVNKRYILYKGSVSHSFYTITGSQWGTPGFITF